VRQPIGGRNLNIGVRHGLLDAKHTHAMGKAILLFEWLVSRQTKGSGLVLGGKPLTYADVAADTGWAERTVRRWMAKLVEKRYVSLKYSVYSRMVIYVLNQKKFESLQLPLGFEAAASGPKVADSRRPEVADIPAKSGRLNHRAEKEHTNQETPSRAAHAGDSRHCPFVEFATAAFRAKHGQPPAWGGRDHRNLADLLKWSPALTVEELCRRWQNFLSSTDPYIASQGDSLGFFSLNVDRFISGPVLAETRRKNAGISGSDLDARNLAVASTAGRPPN
jgi:hypothetical protein